MFGRNDYPSPENYPQPSFPVPVPAPDVDPDDAESSIAVKYSSAWVQVVMAAIDQLVQYSTWAGDDADKKLAADRADTLKYLLQEPTTATGEIPTPFWDEVTDTDDEQPAGTQPWYGYVTDPTLPADELTFVEQAGIWIFTGFLALSGNVGAAILFNTYAGDFTLAMRGDSFVEVIRVIVDAKQHARITTSGDPDDEYIVPIFADPALGSHDVLIVRES